MFHKRKREGKGPVGMEGPSKQNKSQLLLPQEDSNTSLLTCNANIFSLWRNIWTSAAFSDITLVINKEKKHVHKLVLCAFSTTFAAMLQSGTWAEASQKELEIKLEEDEYDTFKIMIDYMYQGEVRV